MANVPYLGLRSVFYPAPDIQTARDWYTRVLGKPPYFDEPFYVGFNVAGFELGLIPDAAPVSGGVVAAWGVGDAHAEFRRLLELGAAAVEEPREVGGGIIVATVRDPFGNHFGIIENPHFPNTEG